MNNHDVSIDPNEATKLLKDILHVGMAHCDAETESTMTANGNREQPAAGHVGGFTGACGENLIDSLFRSSQQQIIQITGGEGSTCTKIFANEVQVYVSPSHDAASSSKMKIKNIVDYGWEHKYNVGQLICLHFQGSYVAYAIRAAASPSGAVRVLNHKTGERTLIKGLRGLVRDMAFARSATRLLLAIVDEYGTLYVYEIYDQGGTLTPERLLQVDRPSNTSPSDYHRVVWCAYVPDEGCHVTDTDDDASSLLVVTMEGEAEVWNVGTVLKEYGCGCLTADKVNIGFQRITEHKQPIADAAFAPDGTALATASCDGEVVFFQVYTQEANVTPRCLHRWTPHNNKPLSCLFFLDNLKTCTQDTQFWKYAITGADNNTELKMWSCESWDCLQTIRFSAPVGDGIQAPALKTNIDLTANYIVLSDVNNKMVYILHVHQERMMQARVVLFASFPVVLPVLNFTIVEAVRCKFKPSTDAEHVERLENDHNEVEREDDICCADKRVEGALVTLFWINTKSLQSCHIVYETPPSASIASAVSLSTLSQNSLGCTDHLSDLSLDTEELEKTRRETWLAAGDSEGKCANKKMQVFAGGEVLLTPSDFASPTHAGSVLSSTPQTVQPQQLPIDTDSLELSPTIMASGTEGSATPILKSSSPNDPLNELTSIEALVLDLSRKSDTNSVPVPDECMVHEKPLEAPPRKLSQRSTASSSSQEVAEILAPSTLLTHDHVGNSTEEEEEELDVAVEYVYTAEPASPNQRQLPLASNTTDCHHPEETAWPQSLDNSQNYPQKTTGLEHLNKLSDSSTEGSTATVSWLGNEICRLQGSFETQGHRLSTLTEAIDAQAQQLQDLQRLLQGLPQCVVQSLSVSPRESSVNEHNTLSRVVTLLEKLEDTHVVAEKHTNAVANTVAAMLGTRLDKAITNEFKNSVMPTITKALEVMKESTRCEINRRMETVEAALKENVSKLIKSKGLTDAVVQGTNSAAQVHMQAACQEVLHNTLIPTVDRICQNLFLQMNDAFQRGTREFLHQVELHVEKQNIERGADMLRRVQQVTDHSLQGFTNRLRDTLSPPDLKGAIGSAIVSPLQELQSSLQQNITEQLNSQQDKLQTVVRDEVKAALKESVTAVTAIDGTTGRAQVMTPVPSADPVMQQQQIALLLRQGHYNAAFQQALTAADLNMVVATCEMVNPTKLFSRDPCPLQQPVLLSLIQQLCADLATKTNTKLSYLEEAVMNLDKANPVTQEHLSSILQLLSKKLTAFVQSHPNHKLARNAKMLCMATQSLLNS